MENWKHDGGEYIESIKDIYIPFLKEYYPIQFDLEENQNWFTQKQENALINFYNIDPKFLITLGQKLEKLYNQKLKEGKIKESSNVLKIRKENSFVSIPRQGKNDEYVIFYPETSWLLSNHENESDLFFLEIEILFKNCEIVLIQEMTGLNYRGDVHLLY